MANTKGNGTAKERAPKKEWTPAEKSANFKSAGAKRTMRVIKAIRALGGVARPSRYAWTPADTTKMLQAIGKELQTVENRFQNPSVRTKEEFTF
jgi:hypothetical protein